MQTYQGSCHCGAVRYEVDAELDTLTQCNCSICTKKGALLLRVKPEQLRILQGEADLQLYQFNKKIARHFFCRHCGIHPFSNPRAAPDLYTINVRTLDGIDPEAHEFTLRRFDGQNWEAAVDALNKGAKTT